MEKTIKHGNFTLTHFDYHGSYFLHYKTRVREYKFNELFGTQLIDRVFKLEPDPEKATEFIVELYQWGFSQQGSFKKILDSVYGEEKQKILDEFHEEKIKILGEVYGEEKQLNDEK